MAELTAAQITEGIAAAIRAHDFEAAISLLRLLAAKDPHGAGVVYESMLAVLDTGGKDAPGEGAAGG